MTIICHRSEMGQGVRSSFPVLLADELGADMQRVKIVQADGDKKYGDQNTDGSSSFRNTYTQMRLMAAIARQMLIMRQQSSGKFRPAECEAENHFVIHRPSGRNWVWRACRSRKSCQSSGCFECQIEIRTQKCGKGPPSSRRARLCHRQGSLRRGHQIAEHAHRYDRAPSGRGIKTS